MEIQVSFPRFLSRLQVVNVILFGIMGVQMILVPLISGYIVLEYFPLGGIFFIFCGLWLASARFHHLVFGKVLFLASSVLTIFLLVYWISLFSGPFNRVLQFFFMVALMVNGAGLIGAFLLPILKVIQQKTRTWDHVHLTISRPRTFRHGNRKHTMIITCFLLGAIGFFFLARYDFGRVYRVQAPPAATTRSSFWGPPYHNTSTVTSTITPVDDTTLIIENASLGTPLHNLRQGAIMRVREVTHPSNTSINYCNYLLGARSFPNGSVFLSQPLPSLVGVSIRFDYIVNVEIYEYLNQMDSRMIHAEGGGNQSWIETPGLFDNIEKTKDYLMLEYWNISYFMHIHAEGHVYSNIFNYNAFTARAHAVLNWIDTTEPHLNDCIGIAFDFEPKDVKDPSMNQDRPPMGTPPGTPFISEEKWFRLNEQTDEVLHDAKEAFFSVYDHANEIGLGTYATFVYNGLEDMSDGDIDYTRLPVWKHPHVEYGTMAYQSKVDDDEAMWQLYWMNTNQQNVYGDQGYSILSGWLTHDEEVHLKHYTNDQEGLDRYLRDIKLSQACGVKELVHAPLHGLQRKWNNEVVLEFEKVLNTDPKEEFVFRAHPWGHLDMAHYDIVENYNKWWIAFPTFVVQITVLLGGLLIRGNHTPSRLPNRSQESN